ncbi:IS256 family transposase [Siminovitchia terrae]|uniref:IS256 family transposase n=1 Tax=Siminovitchia terrae TaxID=1914933 RepID=UPI0026B1FE70
MQNALKDIFGPMFEAMLKGEMDNHLGYDSNDKNKKETDNRRNGYGKKTLKTSAGEVNVKVPRDRDGSFDPQLIPKRKKDVSAIENKVISMYARGMSQRDISTTIEEIYGFSVSHEMISDITDHVLPELEEWQTRPLSNCYAFVFVDCMFTSETSMNQRSMPFIRFWAIPWKARKKSLDYD